MQVIYAHQQSAVAVVPVPVAVPEATLSQAGLGITMQPIM